VSRAFCSDDIRTSISKIQRYTAWKVARDETRDVKIFSGQQFAQMGCKIFVNDFALLGEDALDTFFGMPIDDTVLAYAQPMQPSQFISECSGIANRKSKDGGFEFAPGFRCKAALILAHLICDEDFSRQG